jgi:tetrapyrrole methylase family protein/MazG family protein
VDLVARLRGENGCPWDKKQTPETMRVYLVEEMYELLDALDSKDPSLACEELGDVLFQIVFLARLFEEKELFSVDDVAAGITEKMVRRHPHVFGGARADTADEVRQRWYEFKRGEAKTSATTCLLDSVPKNLPPLLHAYRVIERVSRTGFAWPGETGREEILDALWAAFRDAARAGGQEAHRLLGEFQMALAAYSRDIGLHPDSALKDYLQDFRARFGRMEDAARALGRDLDGMESAAIWELWEKAGENGHRANAQGGPRDEQEC